MAPPEDAETLAAIPVFKQLRVQRAVLMGQLTKTRNYIATNFNVLNKFQLETKLGILEKQFTDFNHVQSQIEGFDEEEINSGKRDMYEDVYCEAKSQILERLESANPRVSIDANAMPTMFDATASFAHRSRATLQKLQLPKFTGSYTTWLDFYSTFSTMVDKNVELTSVEKLQYLRSCVVGEAAKVIQSLEMTDANYDQAVELLKSRYDNKRGIFEDHIKEIFKLQTISRPSVNKLRNMIDTINSNLRALNSIGNSQQIYDGFLLHLLLSKLDSETQAKWEEDVATRFEDVGNSYNSSEASSFKYPTWKQFATFLERRSKTLSIMASDTNRSSVSTAPSHAIDNRSKSRLPMNNSTFVATTLKSNISCIFCGASPRHSEFSCSKFTNLSPTDRFKLVKQLRLCLNCLKPKHGVNNCSSIHKCQRCGGRHHTLLHRQQLDFRANDEVNVNVPPHVIETHGGTIIPSSSSALQIQCSDSQVLLGTALVRLQNHHGTSVIARAVLDSASQLNFVTERIAQFLKLRRHSINVDVNGIGSVNTIAHQKGVVHVKSLYDEYNTTMEVIVLPEITAAQPQARFSITHWNIPANVQLADPHFNSPGTIDMLIGAGLFFELLLNKQLRFADYLPIAQLTHFGWVIAGMMTPSNTSSTNMSCLTPASSHRTSYTAVSTNISQDRTTDELIQRFWIIEDHTPHSNQPKWTAEALECEKFFLETTRQCPYSRKFIVRLPFRQDRSQLGKSYEIARKRLLAIERKLERSLDLKKAYNQFLEEYAKLGHMQKFVPEADFDDGFNYIPHHCVVKLDSSTTKVRVVFDASCQSSSGTSLNNILKVGPTLQDDIFTHLVRFRSHRFVIMADITQMYRQVQVHEHDTNLQCILWRNQETQQIDCYRLQTVTYGTSSAPYLAIRCLRKLAEDNASKFPVGSRVTLHDFYVDNLMSGADEYDEVCQIKDEVTELLQLGSFSLRKWATNHPELISDVSDDHKEVPIPLGDSEVVKALGIAWDSRKDSIRFIHKGSQPSETKRKILSHIAQLYDPLGLMNPFVLKAKLFMQTLWQLKLNWDEVLPDQILVHWNEYMAHFNQIHELQIPRYVPMSSTKTNLHGFSDASMKAYGACVYIRTVHPSGQVTVSLMCAKSRVAPLKEVSLPRLELCAALLLVEMLQKLSETCAIRSSPPIYCWTDSTIVLAWLASEACRWVTFVANRVSKIQSYPEPIIWRHVSSSQNPADLVSRGAYPAELANSQLWFHGPTFLHDLEAAWPAQCDNEDSNYLQEERKSKTVLLATGATDLIISCKYHNDFLKLIRIFCYVRRYWCNSQVYVKEGFSSSISPQEFDAALLSVIHNLQRVHMQEEIQAAQTGIFTSRTNRIRQLAPFYQNGLLRVGGRLSKSHLPFDTAHPILLPHSHPFTRSLIRHFHTRHLHAGGQTLHNILRERFWIPNARKTIRQEIHRCVICCRSKPLLNKQLMADLPRERIAQSKPFAISGVDYCGPIYISQRIRGRAPVKMYIAIFICFATKAVHLEVVGELSTAAFLTALKRFIARRGRCSVIYSDNATNFTGANKELKELYNLFLAEAHKSIVERECLQQGITWKFIPPRSPHFGGLWEAAVKVAKTYIRKIMGNALLTFDELNTACCQVEAIMNSRPLTPISSDPEDFCALTPGHFLVGEPLVTVAEPTITDINIGQLKRYKYVQLIQQQFWNRWSHEYLQQLQLRKKWTTPYPNINQGDLVLIKEDNVPPLKWPMGRVLETHAGDDRRVRVATIKTPTGIFKRTISKLCVLPINEADIRKG